MFGDRQSGMIRNQIYQMLYSFISSPEGA